MNSHLTLLALGFLALGASAPAVAADRALVLRAIHQVENPTDRTTPGPRGELGAYQFRRSTWKMHSPEPFSRANERSEEHTSELQSH